MVGAVVGERSEISFVRGQSLLSPIVHHLSGVTWSLLEVSRGTHCPLIIRIPEKHKQLWPADKPGAKVDRLVSFVDMPKTWLAIAGAKIPSTMQGQIFLGPKAQPERPYHVSWRGRMDERYDNQRAIRNKRFLYVRNYAPYAPWGQRLRTIWQLAATKAWVDHHQADKTNAITGRFFSAKPAEELYDTQADPDNVNNLVDAPEHQQVLNELRAAMDKWQLDFYDAALLPEADMVKRAQDNDLTIYEMVRDPKLYDLKGYQEAANTAIMADAANLKRLRAYVANEDAGIRYWGIVGLLLLGEDAKAAQNQIKPLLQDDSHEVRAMAAFALYRQDETEIAKDALKAMLAETSYATLKVCNVIDWLGADPNEFKEALLANKSKDNYVGRMKEYFGLEK